MTPNPGSFFLSLRIGMGRIGLVSCLVMVFLVTGAAGWLGFSLQALLLKKQQDSSKQARRAAPKPPVRVPTMQPDSAQRNLRGFYEALGDASEAERHISELFNISRKIGLDLDQGEYKWDLDRNSRTYRYQVVLPLKGSYGLIRQFCEKSLLALPFASLDEVTFRREAVGDDTLDGSVTFTIFYSDSPRDRRASTVGS